MHLSLQVCLEQPVVRSSSRRKSIQPVHPIPHRCPDRYIVIACSSLDVQGQSSIICGLYSMMLVVVPGAAVACHVAVMRRLRTACASCADAAGPLRAANL